MSWLKRFFNLDNQRFWEKTENPVEVEPVYDLEEKGFRYNETQDWWQRTWTTPVPNGIETCLEVFKRKDDGWTSIMYGNSGEIFYEQPVTYNISHPLTPKEKD